MDSKEKPKSITQHHTKIVGIIVFVLITSNLRESSLLSEFISEHTGLTKGPLGATVAAVCIVIPVALCCLLRPLIKKLSPKKPKE